jgi:hypothetical protein
VPGLTGATTSVTTEGWSGECAVCRKAIVIRSHAELVADEA